MFEKVKGAIGDIRKNNQLRMEERVRMEKERIQIEKNALMELSEKELIVEAVMALRGTNTRLAKIQEELESISINQTISN